MKKENTMLIKSCYSHIGGKFGNAPAVRLEKLGWIERDSKSKDFIITTKGDNEFKKLGVEYNS
jgi:hypothetical protein